LLDAVQNYGISESKCSLKLFFSFSSSIEKFVNIDIYEEHLHLSTQTAILDSYSGFPDYHLIGSHFQKDYLPGPPWIYFLVFCTSSSHFFVSFFIF
jgi:hypothetical protein